MKEIQILHDLPVIFTKDKDFPKRLAEHHVGRNIRRGQVIILPDDAVLALPPEIVQMEVKPIEIKP